MREFGEPNGASGMPIELATAFLGEFRELPAKLTRLLPSLVSGFQPAPWHQTVKATPRGIHQRHASIVRELEITSDNVAIRMLHPLRNEWRDLPIQKISQIRQAGEGEETAGKLVCAR